MPSIAPFRYDGCAALTCTYAGCGAHFCALCLVECPGDAHAHVQRCRFNPCKGSYHVDRATWEAVMDKRRR